MLEIKNINKSFETNHVLKGISFKANSGSAFGLLGRNGSGKTTTIRVIMGIILQDSGEVLLNSKKINRNKNKIGYLPEERGLYGKRKINEQMIYFGELYGLKRKVADERSKELLKKINAEEYYNKKLETLSKGNQQKIQLAITLLGNPDIIILDEPFSGLDPVNAQVLKDLVRELVNENKIVIFSSHQMANIEEFCDDLCIIHNGNSVLDGNLKEIKKTYPRNSLSITVENQDKEKFKSLIEKEGKEFIISNKIVKEKNILQLKNPENKNNILDLLNSNNIKLDSFFVIEPTLEEIFIEKTGGENETIINNI